MVCATKEGEVCVKVWVSQWKDRVWPGEHGPKFLSPIKEKRWAMDFNTNLRCSTAWRHDIIWITPIETIWAKPVNWAFHRV